ncbi:MAG: regulatory protein GemA [Burkholderiales bacterium]|nr:regulatory protein GemA [Burkholderiales bacterium]
MATKPTRGQHLAAIHIAEKALRLAREDAAALKLQVTGLASSGDMNASQRAHYLAHLAVLQAKAAEARGEKPAYQPKRPALVRNVDDAGDHQWGKARALWYALANASVMHTNTDAALQAFATRQTGVTAWRFMTQPQITQVIESLKQVCCRCGVPTGAGQ